MPQKMEKRHCEIAAESYAAYSLSRAGYNVFVQYGANQPGYDLAAMKDDRSLRISVKGSQNRGWLLAPYTPNLGYHGAIDQWLSKQGKDIVFFFVQFSCVAFDEMPRVYVARPPEIAAHLKKQNHGKGNGSLAEDYLKSHPRSKRNDKIPEDWVFDRKRIDEI